MGRAEKMNRNWKSGLVVALMLILAGCLSSAGTNPENDEPVAETQPPIETINVESARYGHNQPDEEVDTPAPLQNKTTRIDINVTLSEELLIKKLNYHRELNDEKPLTTDPRLARIARHHSYDMATRDFFNHTNPDGVTFTDRLGQSDYACGGGWENIGGTYWKANNTQTEEALAEELMLGFIHSPEHNTAMLDPEMDTVGIGIYVAEDRRTYATMNLCDANPTEEGGE